MKRDLGSKLGAARCRSAALVAALVLLAPAVGCGAPAPKTVSMRVVSAGGPRGASVTVDDQFVGTLDVVAARGVALPPGKHRVTIEAPGHLPWDKLIEAKEGDAPIRLDVKLVPIPD
ncbi:MAG: PEGA domain-containing protein [Deltaproteobacteria bacterium]|nr:PEGA domain-containing protein [Deltaproteobacteria bacterium]